MHRVDIAPGETVAIKIGYSEVACHLRIADRTLPVQIVGAPGREMCQVLTAELEPFSFPITLGEAGIYSDASGFYGYR